MKLLGAVVLTIALTQTPVIDYVSKAAKAVASYVAGDCDHSETAYRLRHMPHRSVLQ